MFVLGAEDSEIRILRLGRLQLRFRLRNRFIGADAGFVRIARKFECLSILAHGGIV